MLKSCLVVALLSGAVVSTSGASIIAAGDPMVDWSGRHIVNANSTVSFDWLGVTARVGVTGATTVPIFSNFFFHTIKRQRHRIAMRVGSS